MQFVLTHRVLMGVVTATREREALVTCFGTMTMYRKRAEGIRFVMCSQRVDSDRGATPHTASGLTYGATHAWYQVDNCVA